MKPKHLFIILCSLLLLVGCASTKTFIRNQERLEEIQRVAVFPFVCSQGSTGYSIADALSAHLLQSRFDVIERSQLNRLLEEQGLTLSGALEDYEFIIGKIKGVDEAIIVGNASMSQGFAGWLYGGYVNYVSSCTAKMIDVVTGELIIAVTFSADSPTPMSGRVTPTKVGGWLAKKLSASQRKVR